MAGLSFIEFTQQSGKKISIPPIAIQSFAETANAGRTEIRTASQTITVELSYAAVKALVVTAN